MSDQNMDMHTPENLNETHHAHMGPILAGLLLLLVLVLVGLWLWGANIAQEIQPIPEQPIVNNEPETPRAVADQQIFETLSPSDEISAIEADIDSTNLDSLDTDLTAIDAELGGIQVQ